MQFYPNLHDIYGGVMYDCVLDAAGKAVLQHNIPPRPKAFLP